MILAIIQARMSSSRLPGKVMLPILGRPVLQWVVDAAWSANLVEGVVVATSTDSTDDIIVDYCNDHEIASYRGELNDVLARFAGAATMHNASHVIRLTADCPLLSGEIIDQVIFTHLQYNADYTHNPTAGDGFDVEVMTANALFTASLEAKLPYEREHVTPYLRSGKFRKVEAIFKFKGEKLSIDTAQDYRRVCKLLGGIRYVH